MNKKRKYIVTLIIIALIVAVFMTIFLLHRKHTKVSESCDFPVMENNLPNEIQENNIISELEPLEIIDTEIPGINEVATDEFIKNEQEISQEPISQETHQTIEKNNTKKQSSTATQETIKKTDDKVTIQNTKEENLPITQPEETKKETVESETVQPEIVEPEITPEQSQENPPKQEDIKENDNVVEKEETNEIDLSKYDYYEKSLNGSYKGFIKDDAEIAKLKSLISTCIEQFGYTNAKIEENADSSLARSGLRYFTANITNVQNAVYNSDYFTISYYAEKEYHISADGKETFFQIRSYIKVK